jgi:uncharacterized protein YbjT (DUF2867 family)
MNGNTALVLGATGMVGHLLVEQLLLDQTYDKVRILVRRTFDISHPKLEPRLVNFSDPVDFKQAMGPARVLFCSVGTTMKKVHRDRGLYRQIDYDIQVNAARWGRALGIAQCVLVSAVGANASSANFYLRLKGEVEQAISAIDFPCVHIMRPSMLLGQRAESRPAERVAQKLFVGLSGLFPPGLAKYRPIAAQDLARAMVAAPKQVQAGVHIYTYKDILKLIPDPHPPR